LQALEALSLDGHFAACFGKASVPFHKPDRRHYDEVAHALGVAAENTIYVGDSETDVETARNARVPIVLVSFGYSRAPAGSLGGDRLIHHFSELPDVIDDLFVEMAMK
jgi:phosphoglycolate phosphatase